MRGGRVGLVVAVALLTGCSASQGAPAAQNSPVTSSPASAHAAASPTATPIPQGVVDEFGQPIETFAEPTWDQASIDAVLDAAGAAMNAFARPDLPYEQWWAELAPLLSSKAQMDYQYVDPANVPARTVTGPPVLVEDTSASVAGVQVPTDVGPYVVTLSRETADSPWVVERITPPEGL